MSLFAEFEKREREVFPHNKIILWDGRMLDCYPLAAQAPDKLDEDHLELDTTGQFLIVGAKKPQPMSPQSKDTEEQKELFIKNAFYLLAHKERIMSDSRMFCVAYLFRVVWLTQESLVLEIPRWASILNGGR